MCESLKDWWENLDKGCKWCLLVCGALAALLLAIIIIVLIVLGATGVLSPK